MDEEIIFAELSNIRKTVRALEKETYSADMAEKLRTIKDEFRSLENTQSNVLELAGGMNKMSCSLVSCSHPVVLLFLKTYVRCFLAP